MFAKRNLRDILLVMAGALLLMAYLIVGSYINQSNSTTAAEDLSASAKSVSRNHASSSPSIRGQNRSYVVQNGDTLYLIATRNGVTVSAIKQANNLGSDLITPGQILTIPSATEPNASRYTVRSGDSLYFIALRYGITADSLKQANGLTSDLIIPGQVLTVPGGPAAGKPQPGPQPSTLRDILRAKGITSPDGLVIVVSKSAHTLSLFNDGTWLKTYHVELGDGGTGDKAVSGDHKTPEGTFYITEKSVLDPPDEYLGSRWMRLSYPNAEDAERGLRQGLIDQETYNEIVAAIAAKRTPPQYTSLGGGIGIHGGSTPAFGRDWTWGCVGLTNEDIEEIYDYIKVGTPVFIQR